MNGLKPEEKTFLEKIKPQLKEGCDENAIINALRSVAVIYRKQGKGGWSVDHQWTDEQLR